MVYDATHDQHVESRWSRGRGSRDSTDELEVGATSRAIPEKQPVAASCNFISDRID